MMAQTTFGQTDALALAIVAWLTANEADFSTPIAATRRFRLITDLKAMPAADEPANVDLFPDFEHGERQGTSTAFASQYAVHLFIQQKVGALDEQEENCARLTQLRSEIIEALKARMFNLSNAVHPVERVFLAQVRNADKGLYDLHRLTSFNVYESDTILVFKAAV